MGENIKVNSEVLKQEIQNLNSLFNKIQDNKSNGLEIRGKGYTVQYMEVVRDSFIGLRSTIEYLVFNTAIMLDNVSDGYIDMDEMAAKKIEEFKNEVLGNE